MRSDSLHALHGPVDPEAASHVRLGLASDSLPSAIPYGRVRSRPNVARVALLAALVAPSMAGCSVYHWDEVDAGVSRPAQEAGSDVAASLPDAETADASVTDEDDGATVEASVEDERDTGPRDTGADQNTVATLALADHCAEVPFKTSSNDPVSLTGTSTLTDDVSDLSGCGISRNVRGSDGFLAVQMNAGERWHFHVHGAAEQDLSLFLIQSCDARMCVKAVDRCPKGQDEHLTVIAPTSGTYYLGIDGLDGQATSAITALAVHPICGDGTKGIHSKVCEDGNNVDGDGCDSNCRPEIKDTGAEAEPNGDIYGANVLRFAETPTVVIKGQIGGPCDTDMFSMPIPVGGTVRAVLRNESNLPCTADLPPVSMKITDGAVTLATGAPTADSGTCPTITFGPATTAGEYFLSFQTENATVPFHYQLEVALTK